MLNEIIEKIKKVNDERIANNDNLISEDDSNEEILNILKEYFIEDFKNGIDIDNAEFLENKFGKDYETIRDAEGSSY